ncbi:MAG TPA: DoxX subfamily [Bacteroidales bacterium]|nr:DoxX subfamily [Bacteroidales bacterium]
MTGKTNYSNSQLTLLVVLRVLIGWHFLYEGLSKLVNPDWSSVAFLLDSKGVFSSLFSSLATNPNVLKIVDFMNIWGLILIGLGLILGLFTRISIIAGIALLGIYYLSHPPMVGFSFSVPSEGSYLWVNKNLIELAALSVLLVFPTWKKTGIDRFIF